MMKMVKNIKQVAVIGAGSMGHQISMLSALGGFETYLQDIEDKSLDQAKETLTKRMNKWVEQGKISELEKNEAFDKLDRKSTRLNSSHVAISYAVFCLKKKKKKNKTRSTK